MHKNSYKIDIKKCHNVAINAIDSNTYPYYVLLCLFMQQIYTNDND
jgi:type I restriction-modification system DNA methylase subunit